MIARYAENKRQDVLLAACAPHMRRDGNLRLLLVGDGDHGASSPYSQAMARIEQEDIRRQVLCLPVLSPIDIAFHASDLFVLPSEGEPWARSILEAMAASLPVIASDSGGTPEQIEHNRTGVLFPAGDAGALSTLIAHALQNLEKMAALARNGLKFLNEAGLTARSCAAETLRAHQMARENGAPMGWEPRSTNTGVYV